MWQRFKDGWAVMIGRKQVCSCPAVHYREERYSSKPEITLTGGTGATATCEVKDGVITSVTINHDYRR